MQSACDASYWHLWPVWLYHALLHYLKNDTICRISYWIQNKCFDFFTTLSETFLFREELGEISYMYIDLHVKYPLFLSLFHATWNSSTDSLKMLKYSVSLTNGSRVVHWGQTHRQTDGQIDRHEDANSRFKQFCERAYKLSVRWLLYVEWKRCVMAHAQKRDLVFQRNGPFISVGVSVQSTAGSRGVRISGSNAR